MKFTPPEYWDLRQIRAEYSSLSTSAEQNLYLAQVEDAIEEIWDDIQIERNDPDLGPLSIEYEEIPDILRFIEQKRHLNQASATAAQPSGEGSAQSSLTEAERLKFIDGRIEWILSRKSLEILLKSLSDYDLIPSRQQEMEFAQKHFWLLEDEEARLQSPNSAGGRAADDPFIWQGELIQLVELFWALDGEFMRVAWKNGGSIVRNFSCMEEGSPKSFNAPSIKSYRQRLEKEENEGSRLNRQPIGEIIAHMLNIVLPKELRKR